MSTKDLLYIEDMFNWNLNIYNTVTYLESSIEDDTILKLMNKIKKVHESNMKEICEVLGNE